jgi:hypothetical protein
MNATTALTPRTRHFLLVANPPPPPNADGAVVVAVERDRADVRGGVGADGGETAELRDP